MRPPFELHEQEVEQAIEDAMQLLHTNKSIRPMSMYGRNGRNVFYELTDLGKKPIHDQKLLLDAYRTLPKIQIHPDLLKEVEVLWRIGSYDTAIQLVMATMEDYAKKELEM